jgi:STE24 endopeptidase
MKSTVALLLVTLSCLVASPDVRAQEPSPAPTVAPVPSIAPGADPAAATRAWLDTVPPDKRAKSDAYFEGGYWLILWNFLVSAAISIFLLASRISARMRDFAERRTRFKALQVAIYAVAYFFVTSVLAFPLLVYQRFFREHQYGLATQDFGEWFVEQVKEFGLGLVGIPLLLMALYAVFRRAPRTWWLWGTAVVVSFQILGVLIAPLYIEPIFNKYKPLADGPVRESILTLARANQIPVKQVLEVDASRQTNRISANVAGFLGTTRIALNDNLLKRCTLPEIRAVMAHEMGHYVLNHMAKLLLNFGLLILIIFALTKVFFAAALRRWGGAWQVRDLADPAGLPLLALSVATIAFVFTPLNNTIVRVAEVEADSYGVNSAREADGFAQVALKLGEYRKLDPGPLEEFIFFDHPSGRARIRMAMDWKAANLPCGEAGANP